MTQNKKLGSPLSEALKRLRKNRAAVIACVILGLIVLSVPVSLLLESFEVIDPDVQELTASLTRPCSAHPMGTDLLGRDILFRCLAGARISLLVGLVATLVSLVIGMTWGAVAGYLGGHVDNIMMRIVDILYSLPFIFLVIMLLGLFERSLVLLFVALGAVQWLTMARIVRGQVLSIREMDFITAAVSLGMTRTRIIFMHVIPNLLGIIIVYATLTIPQIMLQEAFLSFLGLGVPGQEHSWGMLISEGIEAITPLKINWWLVVFPGLCITVTLFALNFIGDGLRDALDPYTRQE
jgi:oligopeptide transport system permease protein